MATKAKAIDKIKCENSVTKCRETAKIKIGKGTGTLYYCGVDCLKHDTMERQMQMLSGIEVNERGFSFGACS